jgi:hypothetical protein
MPSASAPERLRILSRHCVEPRVRLNQIRPSVLEPGLRGDLWLVRVAAEVLALRCNYHTLAHLDGLAVDASSLNDQLYRLRHRFPRKSPYRRSAR